MNPEAIHYLNVFLGLGVIITQILCAFALFLLFFGPKKNFYLDFINKHVLVLGFLFALDLGLLLIVFFFGNSFYNSLVTLTSLDAKQNCSKVFFCSGCSKTKPAY